MQRCNQIKDWFNLFRNISNCFCDKQLGICFQEGISQKQCRVACVLFHQNKSQIFNNNNKVRCFWCFSLDLSYTTEESFETEADLNMFVFVLQENDRYFSP